MDCEELFFILSDYFDQELEMELYDEMEEHIKTCCYCEFLFDTFSKTLELCSEMEQLEVSPEVHLRIIQLIRIEIENDTR